MSVQEDKKLKATESEFDVAADMIHDAEEGEDGLKAYEGDILDAMIDAANYADDKSETYKIRVIRNKTIMLEFHIHPLSESDYDMCRKKNTKYARNRRMGIMVPEKTNSVRYRSQLIYEATTAEDRAKLWDQKAMWGRLGVLSGIDAIDRILKSGEKDKICEQIDKISGYDDNELEEIVKN